MTLKEILIKEIDNLTSSVDNHLSTDIIVEKLMEAAFWVDTHNKLVLQYKKQDKDKLPKEYHNLKLI